MKKILERLKSSTALDTIMIRTESRGRLKFDDWWLFHGYREHIERHESQKELYKHGFA